jgi:hypothetical protein
MIKSEMSFCMYLWVLLLDRIIHFQILRKFKCCKSNCTRNNKTWQWSTQYKYNPPTPGIMIPNASGKQYFATVSCPNEENCNYELSSQLNPRQGAGIFIY